MLTLKLIYSQGVLNKHKQNKHAAVLGQRIRQLRKEKGLSLADLAYQSDPQLTRHHLSQIETGKKYPSVRVLFGLAERLEVEVFELFLVGVGKRVSIAEMVRGLPYHRVDDLYLALEKEFSKKDQG